MESSTKNKILDVALDLFSQRGVEGTSMSDIAGELGLTKAALYRHFSGKEEILETIMDIGEAYYENTFGSLAHLPEVPESIEELKQLSWKQIDFTMHDSCIVKLRKFCVIDQFYCEKLAELATKHFVTGLENMYAMIFQKMMERGILKQSDPDFLAFEYVSPINAMIHLRDRQPEREEDILERIRKHIDYCLDLWAA